MSTHLPEGLRSGTGDDGGDAIETLLRVSRPGEAPLDEARAQEIFARALALSGASAGESAAPEEPKGRPWWLPRFPQLTLPTWGAAGLAATAACGIAAISAVVLHSHPAVVVPPTVATISGEGAARAGKHPGTTLSSGPTVARETIKPVPSPVSATPEVGEKAQQPQQRRSRSHRPRRSLSPGESKPAPEAAPRFGHITDTMLATNAVSSDLLVVASGTTVPVQQEADVEADTATAPGDGDNEVVALNGEDETLTVAVSENVPADQPGRAEAAAVREVPVGPAGPTGPEGDMEGAEGPAGPSSSSAAITPPATRQIITPTQHRTILVWAQASVATNEQPSLVLTQIRVEVR